jgi:hypothetical protein
MRVGRRSSVSAYMKSCERYLIPNHLTHYRSYPGSSSSISVQHITISMSGRPAEGFRRNVEDWNVQPGNPEIAPSEPPGGQWDGVPIDKPRRGGKDGRGGTSRPTRQSSGPDKREHSAHRERESGSKSKSKRSTASDMLDFVTDGIHRLIYKDKSPSRRSRKDDASHRSPRRTHHSPPRRSETDRRITDRGQPRSSQPGPSAQSGGLRDVHTETWPTSRARSSRHESRARDAEPDRTAHGSRRDK